MDKLRFLIAVFFKSLFAHKQLIICALISGLCCLAILVGAAVVFSPTDQYQHFTSELFCQWAFDEPVDYAVIAPLIARDAEDISAVHVFAKAHTENGPVLVYGVSPNVFDQRNAVMYGGAEAAPLGTGCYIDPCFIPYEYDVHMDELVVSINGVEIHSVGKGLSPSYVFPQHMIPQIGYDETLSVSCSQNVSMRVFSDADVLLEPADYALEQDIGTVWEHYGNALEQDVGAVYVPLDLMEKLHIRVGAMTLTMNEPLTEQARTAFESRYQALGFQSFSAPGLSNWSRLTHEMLNETIKEMWAVEIIMFACMINQLVFWEILMRRLKPVIARCRMLGGSKLTLRVALTVCFTLLALLVLCLAAPVYALWGSGESARIHLSALSATSASVIWVVGLVAYCLLTVREKARKGR